MTNEDHEADSELVEVTDGDEGYGGLTPEDEALAVLLSEGMTQVSAGEVVGISSRTVYLSTRLMLVPRWAEHRRLSASE